MRRADWWISVALGHRMFAIFGNGKRERWTTDKVSKGPVYGLHIGRID